MNSLGRNIPNKNIEKTFSGDNLYKKKKINDNNDICNANGHNNNNKNNLIPSGHNSSMGHKLKNSFTNVPNPGTTSPQKKEKLIRISEFKIEPSTQNQDNKNSINNDKDLINRLKNQASSLKSTITNKNQINNKNKAVGSIKLDEKENDSINKQIQKELSHLHIANGVNILSKHDTFEIDQKKHIYGDKNIFNKNSHFLNDKNNNSNANLVHQNLNNKDFDIIRKIKNLKTFHPTKFSNKKSISIKVNKDNLDKENNKNINTQNNIETNNKININDNKNEEDFLINKNKNISKSNVVNKSRDKIKKEKNNSKPSSKEKKSDKKENLIENQEQNKNNKINEENIKNKNEEDKTKEDVEKNNEKKEKEIIENEEKKNEKNIEIKEQKQQKEKNTKIKNQENNVVIEKVEISKKKREALLKNKNSVKEKEIKEEEEKDNIIIIKNNDNVLSNLIDEKKVRDQEEKVIYFDTSNIKDIQIPKEYLNIIYYNLLKEENIELNPKPVHTYMKNQKEINDQMRSILVDWIIDVHHKFGFTDETLFMTILIIDRYCSVEQISRIKYQCLGITALMIACKHEEINVPKVEDFIYITDNAYTKDEVFKMENDVLSKLKFSLLYPSPIKFYEYLSLHFNFSKKYHMLGKYLMESFLLDLKYVKYKSSIISCACAYIVMKFFKMPNYRHSYDKKFYLVDENINTIPNGLGVKDCAQDICVFVDNINNTNLLSCQKKYTKSEFESVSTLISNNNKS